MGIKYATILFCAHKKKPICKPEKRLEVTYGYYHYQWETGDPMGNY